MDNNGIIGIYDGVPIEIVPKLADGEVIVMRWDINKYDISTIHHYYDVLIEEIGEGRVVILPTDVSFNVLDKNGLIAFRDMINQMIGEK